MYRSAALDKIRVKSRCTKSSKSAKITSRCSSQSASHRQDTEELEKLKVENSEDEAARGQVQENRAIGYIKEAKGYQDTNAQMKKWKHCSINMSP